MAKPRFRHVKQSKHHTSRSQNATPHRTSVPYASAGTKMKAFLTDSFMLLMPVMYAVIYLVMGGLPNVAQHRMETWLFILLPFLVIQTIFMVKTGQTPGYKAYAIEVVDERTLQRPSIGKIVVRNLTAIVSLLTIVGWMGMFVRQDKKNLHDILSGTVVVRQNR